MKRLCGFILCLVLFGIVAKPSYAAEFTIKTPEPTPVVEETQTEPVATANPEGSWLFDKLHDVVDLSEDERKEKREEIEKPFGEQAKSFAADMIVSNIPWFIVIGILLAILMIHNKRASKMRDDDE